MNRTLLLKISLAISLLCVLSGLVLKILLYPISEGIIIISLLSALVFLFVALPEVWSCRTINISEKIMWTVGFFVMMGLTGFLYLIQGRKRVLKAPRAF